MDERRLLLLLPPFWRALVIDLTLASSWVVCVWICCPLVQLATDHPLMLCVVESLAPGTLIFWGAFATAHQLCVSAEERIRKRKSTGRRAIVP